MSQAPPPVPPSQPPVPPEPPFTSPPFSSVPPPPPFAQQPPQPLTPPPSPTPPPQPFDTPQQSFGSPPPFTQPFTPPQQPFLSQQYPVAPMPPSALSPKRKTGLIVGLTTGGILLLAMILISVFVVLPQFTKLLDVGSSASASAPATDGGSSGTTNTQVLGEDGYMADFRELPGMVVVDAQEGLSRGSDWWTYFEALPELNMALAFNSIYSDTFDISYNLVGIDLAAGVVTWTFDFGDAWGRGTPQLWKCEKDETQVLLELGDPAADLGSSTMLILLDAKTGTVKASQLFTGLRDFVIHGDTVVIQDEDGLRALGADLVTRKWAVSSVRLLERPEEGYDPYYRDILPGGYLLTDNGYLSLTDGRQASFAKNAGQDGISIRTLDGSPEGYVQVEVVDIKDYSFNYSGFDLTNNKTTWRVSETRRIPMMAGDKLITEEGNEIGAYHINGNELESQWRYSCKAQCRLGFADVERVFILDFGGGIVILNTADGSVIGVIDGVSFIVGKSVIYVERDMRLAAYDLNQEGLPLLWRSEEFHGIAKTLGNAMILDSSNSFVYGAENSGGLLGIIGLDGDGWDRFAI